MVEGEEEQLPLAKRVGRPTKFNDATLDRLCGALADGMSIKSARVVAGIGVKKATAPAAKADAPNLAPHPPAKLCYIRCRWFGRQRMARFLAQKF
jgi:hypothetical protein